MILSAVISGMIFMFFRAVLTAKTRFSKSLAISEGLLKKLFQKMIQYVLSRHSVRTTTTLFPRYLIFLAQWYQNLKLHFMALCLMYCFTLDILLNLNNKRVYRRFEWRHLIHNKKSFP